MMNRLALILVGVVAAVVGVRLLMLLERLLSDDHSVVRDLARSHVPEPAPEVVVVDSSGRPVPDWQRWPVRGEVDPTDEGLPSVLATAMPRAPWEEWPEPLVEEPELG